MTLQISNLWSQPGDNELMIMIIYTYMQHEIEIF